MKQLVFLIVILHSFVLFSQKNEKGVNANFNLNEIAILDIEPSTSSVSLNLVTPLDSGEKVRIITANNNKWINFSSAISNNSSKRNLSIKIEDGEVPTGIHLKLNTSNYSGIGEGELGEVNSDITLSKSSQVIISNIGGAYTGNGINNGYKLIYSLEIYDYKLLDMDNSETLTISLTLTDF